MKMSELYTIGERVEIGCSREAAEPPFLLIPAAATDPGGRLMRGDIAFELLLRFGQAVGVGEIEAQGLEAQARNVTVRVDQAGQQGAVLPVEAEFGPRRPRVAVMEQPGDAAVAPDQQPAEMFQIAIVADRVAIDVVDQSLRCDRDFGGWRRLLAGQCRRGEDSDGAERNHARLAHRPSLRTIELVSCLPPPITCTSA